MKKTISIAIDTLGSDKGPEAVILGASMALKEFPFLKIALAGDEDLIKQKIQELDMDANRITILDAKETITNFDNPTTGIYTKPNASLLQCMKLIKNDDNYVGMITAGSSGAILMGSFRYLSLPERTRPCMAAVLPHAQDGFTCLVDTGATIDCTSEELVHFAHLGSDFMKKLYKMESPRVGLLSNGAEPTKGNHLVKETHPLLAKEEDINFIGNIEGNKSLSGDCDVLVADGFAGNQVLKNSEGMAIRIITDIAKYGKKTNNPACKEIIHYLMGIYDFSALGGGIVLGIRKPVIKARGNSDERAIVGTVKMLINYSSDKSFFEGE